MRFTILSEYGNNSGKTLHCSVVVESYARLSVLKRLKIATFDFIKTLTCYKKQKLQYYNTKTIYS
jgi:predicted transcriptional regulator